MRGTLFGKQLFGTFKREFKEKMDFLKG